MQRPKRHASGLKRILLPLFLLLAAPAAPNAGEGDKAVTSPASDQPGAEFLFASAANLARDSSGNRLPATLAGGACAPGRRGACLELDGSGGLEIANAAALHTDKGFTVDFWVKFPVLVGGTLCAKDGEFMLRLDPPAEGNHLSFFVNAGKAAP